jgi:hypothetical protein
MSTEVDPTQTGGTEAPAPSANPRNAVEAAIAAQVHAAAADELASFNEDTGEIAPKAETPREEAAAPAAAPEPGEQVQAPAPEPDKPRMLTIIVDGQPIEVEESKALEAGKRTLQKDTAADRRLQDATRRLQEAQAAQRRNEEQAAYIRQVAQQHGIELQAPSQDAPQPSQQTTPALDPAALGAMIENQMYIRDAQRAATKFWSDYPDIAADQHLRQMAANLEQQRLDAAKSVGEPFGDPFDAYRKHGDTIRDWLKQRTAPAATAAQPITDKTERKRTITAIPAVNARASAPEEKRPPTVSEIIEAERVARTQGRRAQRIHQ